MYGVSTLHTKLEDVMFIQAPLIPDFVRSPCMHILVL